MSDGRERIRRLTERVAGAGGAGKLGPFERAQVLGALSVAAFLDRDLPEEWAATIVGEVGEARAIGRAARSTQKPLIVRG